MKKTITFIAGLFVFTFVISACVGPTETQIDQPEDTTGESSNVQDTSSVQEQLDSNVVVEAVVNKNLDLCETIETTDLKDDCVQRVNDEIKLDEAKADTDLEKCEEIVDEETQERCKILVGEQAEAEAALEEEKMKNEAIDKQRAEDEKNLYELLDGRAPTVEDCEIIQDPDFKESCKHAASLGQELN